MHARIRGTRIEHTPDFKEVIWNQIWVVLLALFLMLETAQEYLEDGRGWRTRAPADAPEQKAEALWLRRCAPPDHE